MKTKTTPSDIARRVCDVVPCTISRYPCAEKMGFELIMSTIPTSEQMSKIRQKINRQIKVDIANLKRPGYGKTMFITVF
jgi:hypothetical protein